MRHNASTRVKHMLDHAREAEALTRTLKRADLDDDRVLGLALVRLLEIVGEAAGRIPGEMRDEHAEIPWSQIISLRNRLIHGYDSVDMDVVWQILWDDLPPLIRQPESLLNEES
jgi:uncharacterized protein with HEPN domain